MGASLLDLPGTRAFLEASRQWAGNAAGALPAGTPALPDGEAAHVLAIGAGANALPPAHGANVLPAGAGMPPTTPSLLQRVVADLPAGDTTPAPVARPTLPVRLITDAAGLRALCAEVRTVPRIAVDVETTPGDAELLQRRHN